MSPPPLSGEQAGLGKAAKRLSGWAANLLATGLIVVTALALGTQVRQWWRDKPQVAVGQTTTGAGSLGQPDRPHVLELGNIPFALRRSTLVGRQEDVFAALREEGVKAVGQPIELRTPPGPAEVRMLRHLGATSASAREPGRWEVYELAGPILLVAGVRLDSSRSPGESLHFPATDGRRVVYWGLAFPSQRDFSSGETKHNGSGPELAWTLFSYYASQSSRPVPVELANIGIPNGAHGTISLSGDDGSRLVGFQGPGDSLAWSRHFERELTGDGWSLASPWRQADEAWNGRFVKGGSAIDVQWGPDSTGELVGLATISPPLGDGR